MIARANASRQSRTPAVWLVNLFCGVGASPTGVLLDSLAQALERRGWRVEVVTGSVGYNGGARNASLRFRGKVHRLYSGPLDSRGVWGRLLSWLGFYLATAVFAFTRRLPDQVVLMTTPPFLHALFAFRNYFARRKATLVLWNQDTYPEVLASVGLLGAKSFVYRGLLALESWGAQRVHRTVVLDECMSQRLRQHGATDIRIIPNWEIGDLPRAPSVPLAEQISAWKKQWRYLVLYTGNYGWGHNLEGLWRYLRQHPRQRTFFFLFVGGGEKWSTVQRLQEEGLECLRTHPYVPREQVHALIEQADFGLAALESACTGLMSPSKIHGYLARGKPLLYVGPAHSNIAEALDGYGCGVRLEDDASAWERLEAAVAAEDFQYAALAQNAVRAFAQRYNEEVGTAEFIELLTADHTLTEARPPGAPP